MILPEAPLTSATGGGLSDNEKRTTAVSATVVRSGRPTLILNYIFSVTPSETI